MVILFSVLGFLLLKGAALQAGPSAIVQIQASQQGKPGSLQELNKKFQEVIKPREKRFLYRSLRTKKYKIVQKNLQDFKAYLLKEGVSESHFQDPKTISIYQLLYDKILWIDGFKTGYLKHFTSPYYADRFFKKHDSIFDKQGQSHERKQYD